MISVPLTTPGGGRTVYTGRLSNLGIVVLAPGLAALAWSSGRGWDASVAVMLAITLVVMVTAGSVRTAAGPRGVIVSWGLGGWPRLRYPVERIAHAGVVDLPWWMVSAGWWWTSTTTHCTVRGGPTLELRLTDGRRVLVSVPDPQAAVDALAEAGVPAGG